MATDPAPADERSRALADGHPIRYSGSASGSPDGPECVNTVRWALDSATGMSTPLAYGNEESVGQALRDSGVRVTRCT